MACARAAWRPATSLASADAGRTTGRSNLFMRSILFMFLLMLLLLLFFFFACCPLGKTSRSKRKSKSKNKRPRFIVHSSFLELILRFLLSLEHGHADRGNDVGDDGSSGQFAQAAFRFEDQAMA